MAYIKKVLVEYENNVDNHDFIHLSIKTSDLLHMFL